MTSLMNSVSGVRGIVGKGLTPVVVSRYAGAFGNMIGRGAIVIGRDTRISGEMMEHAVLSGLMAAGCSVLNLGISTTPTIQLAVERKKANGGIAITASHNPAEWNAMKFLDERGMYLTEDKRLELENIMAGGAPNFVEFDKLGAETEVSDFDDEHIKAILGIKEIEVEKIRKRQFKAVVDCVNGAGSRILPRLLEELGCEVARIHCEPGGIFPRGPEPTPENLGLLCKLVKENRADIGFACDPDGDRLSVVDENGNSIGEEYSLVLSAMQVLSRKSGPVATNLSTTSAIDAVADRYGAKVFRTKVGEIHVAQEMIDNGCVIGGEGNGGVIHPDVHYGRDSLAGIVLILQLLVERDEPVSSIVSALPGHHMTKLKTVIDKQPFESIIEKIKSKTSGAEINTLDGIKVIFPSYWVHLRLSNTEPVLRVIAEAPTREEADDIAERFMSYVKSR